MSCYVLDANVLVKWFVPEDWSSQAVRLLEEDHHFVVPDLIYPETANAIWQKVRRHQITAREASVALDAVAAAPLTVHPSRSLVLPALELALQVDCTVYDGCYLALAVLSDCPLVTGDRRFAAQLPAALRRHLLPLSSLAN